MGCKVKHKMFVIGSRVEIRSKENGRKKYECVLSDYNLAGFALLVKGGCCGKTTLSKSFSFTRIISNDPLDYFNVKELKVIFDPRQ